MAGQKQQSTLSWSEVTLAPVVLISSKEALFADRALSRLRAQAIELDGETETTWICAPTYASGQLDVATSPSLFGERRLLIIDNLEQLTDALIKDMIAYLQAPQEDVWVILRHNRGTRGKKLLDAVVKAGFPVVKDKELKTARDKAELLRFDARSAHRKVTNEAIEALVDALGSDVQEMCAALAQLMADVQGTVKIEDVHRYHSGRVEATGFAVADAAIAGDGPGALMALRHTIETGNSPVAVVGAITMKIRALAKVSVLSQKRLTPGELGLSPWQIDRAKRDLTRWNEASLGQAISALAQADAEVKGQAKDPVYAVERCVLKICSAASGTNRR